MKILGWLAVFAFALIPIRALFLVAYKIYLGIPFGEDDIIMLAMGGVGIGIAMVIYRTLVAPRRVRPSKDGKSPTK